MKEWYIFRIMLVASKKAITRKWLKTEAPKREDWVEVMHNIYMMESLTLSLVNLKNSGKTGVSADVD